MTTHNTHIREPWLSILIPVYNVSAYIGQCLDSVLTQSADDPNIEIILLDDASSDDSWVQVEEYAKHYHDKLRLFRHPENRGLSAARNTLIKHANGRYFWFIDSDDMMLPGAIEGLRNIVNFHQPDLIMCDYRLLDETKSSQSMYKRTHTGPSNILIDDPVTLLSGVLIYRQPHIWSKIAKRHLWANVKFPDDVYFEDIAALPSLLTGVRTWWHTTTPWMLYRRRNGSISTSLNEKNIHDLVLASEMFQQGILSSPASTDPKVATSLDYFQLRTFYYLATYVKWFSPNLENICRQSLNRIFPHGTRHAIENCRNLGMYPNGWNARHRLARVGWLT